MIQEWLGRVIASSLLVRIQAWYSNGVQFDTNHYH